MEATQELDAQILELVRDGVVLIGAHDEVAYMNAAAGRMVGWSTDEARGKPIDEVICVFNEDGRPTSLERYSTSSLFRSLSLMRRDGEICRVVARLSWIQSSRCGGYVLLMLRAKRRVDRLVRRLSRRNLADPITGLLNRSALENEIEQRRHWPDRWVAEVQIDAMTRSPRPSRDAFDSLVRRVGEVFTIRTDIVEVAARISDHGFVLLLEARCAEEVRSLCERLSFLIEGLQPETARLTSRIGIVRIDSAHDASSILEAAHVASKIAAQRSEREIYIMDLGDAALRSYRRQTNLHGILASILRGDCIQLFYQPVVPLRQTDEAGERFELLSRIVDEEGRSVSAFELIADAEANGLAGKIDRVVVRKSFECLYRIYGNLSARKLACASINLSASSLGDEALLDMVLSELDRGNVDPRRVCFEITESSSIKDVAEARAFIECLRNRGCSFSLDDFGSDNASFVRLLDLGYFEYLKIDGALIQRLDKDPVAVAVVASISDIAKRMGMRTVAEYVDRESLMDKLRLVGIDFAQGYLVGRPMPFR
jgi:Amt family ammonium transporter